MATEVVEVQVKVEDEDPGVNTRGLMMLGIAAGGDRQCSVAERAYFFSQERCVIHNGQCELSMIRREQGTPPHYTCSVQLYMHFTVTLPTLYIYTYTRYDMQYSCKSKAV